MYKIKKGVKNKDCSDLFSGKNEKKQVSIWIRLDQYHYLKDTAKDSISERTREIIDRQLAGYRPRTLAVLEFLEALRSENEDFELERAVNKIKAKVRGGDIDE